MANTAKKCLLENQFPLIGINSKFQNTWTGIDTLCIFWKFNGVVIENFNGFSIGTMFIPETSWGEISVKKLIPRSESWQDWGIEKLLYFGWVAPPNIRAFLLTCQTAFKPRHIRLRTLFLESELSLNNKYKEKHPQNPHFYPLFRCLFLIFHP